MATMIPKDPLILKNKKRKAEKKVFEKLTKLDQNVHVVHGLLWTEGGRDYEADFVIIDPRRRAILVLEVKGGGISLENGQWYSTDEKGQTYEIDPVAQARNASYAIKNMIHGKICSEFRWGWGIIFPDAICPDEIPTKEKKSEPVALVSRERIIDRSDLEKPIDAVDRVFKDFTHDNVEQVVNDEDKKFAQDILDVINPQYKFGLSISSYMEYNEEEWISLKKFQLGHLKHLEDDRYRRHRIVGGAGTGKTVIATEAVVREAQKNKKVLYLCFNTLLAKAVLKKNAELPKEEKYTAYTYGKLCERILNKAERHSSDDVLEALEEYRQTLDENKRVDSGFYWDVVIVDEGQDFEKDSWNVIKKLVKDENSRLWVFYDPYQAIRIDRDRIDSMIPIVEEDIQSYEVLPFNYRNTQTIGKTTNELIKEEIPTVGKPGLDLAPHGVPIKYVEAMSPEETGALVKGQVEYWIKEGIPGGQIAVLTTVEACNDSYNQISRTCGNILHDIRKHAVEQSTERRNREVAQKRPTLVSVESFKGLDTDAVVLVVPTNSEEDHWKIHYVGVSRARQFLTVVRSPIDIKHFKGYLKSKLEHLVNEMKDDEKDKCRNGTIPEKTRQKILESMTKLNNIKEQPDEHIEFAYKYLQEIINQETDDLLKNLVEEMEDQQIEEYCSVPVLSEDGKGEIPDI